MLVLAGKPVHYVLFSNSFIMLICKTIEISVLNVNSNSFPGLLIIGTFEKWASGLSYVFAWPCSTSSPGHFSLALEMGCGGAPHLQSQRKAPWGRGRALWASVHDLKVSRGLRRPSPRSNTDTIALCLTSQVSPHVKEF